MPEQLIVTERELKEIRFAMAYSNAFDHGTPGHNHLKLIAKLAEHIGFTVESGQLQFGTPDCVDVDWDKPTVDPNIVTGAYNDHPR